MSFTASDFLLSIADLFVILLPGFFLIFFLALIFEWWNNKTVRAAWEKLNVGKWVVLLASSFLIGHFVSQFGAWTEDAYYRSNLTSISDEYPKLRKDAMQLASSKYHLQGISEFNVRRWSARLIRIKNENAANRIDRKDAERRLFRNMVVVSLLGVVLALVTLVVQARKAAQAKKKAARFPWPRLWLVVGFSLCLVLSFARYQYQSDKYTKEIFETFIALSSVPKES